MKNKSYDAKSVVALRDWLSLFDWQYLVVLSPNKETRDNRINPDFFRNRVCEIDEWHKRSDRKLLGKRWSRNPNRTSFVAFPEIGPKSGLLHFNVVLHPPAIFGDPADLWQAYSWAWFDLMPDSEVDIQPIVPGTIEELVSYSSKWLSSQMGSEGWFFSNERQSRPAIQQGTRGGLFEEN